MYRYVVITVLLTSRPFLAVEVYEFTTLPDIIEDQSITLFCKYNRSVPTSTGPATTTWYRYMNDKEERVASSQGGYPPLIQDEYADRFQVDQNGNLVISITRYDAGIYKCEVIIYDDIPKISAETLNITVYYADKPTIYIIPSQVMVGDNVKIICNNNDANPEPMLQIYNGHLQESSNRNFQNYTKKTTKDDSGDYYCVARNKAGNKTSDSRKLTIYFIEIPELVIMNVTKDNSYIIECQCPVSVPVPQLFIIHNNVTIKSTTGFNLTYRLEKVTKKDEGDYKCIAENLAGKRNSEIHNLGNITDSTDSTSATNGADGKVIESKSSFTKGQLITLVLLAISFIVVLLVGVVLKVQKRKIKDKRKRAEVYKCVGSHNENIRKSGKVQITWCTQI